MLSVLDTAGQEEFFAMRDSWIRNGDCFVLVYSITSRSSFEELKQIHESIHRVKDRDEETGAVPICLVGNKSDLSSEREVSKEEAEALAKKWRCAHFELGEEPDQCHRALPRGRPRAASCAPRKEPKGGGGKVAKKRWASMCSIHVKLLSIERAGAGGGANDVGVLVVRLGLGPQVLLAGDARGARRGGTPERPPSLT